MDTPEMQKEFQAVMAFVNSISRQFKDLARWPYPKMREPRAYAAWRFYAGILRRFQLYAAADLEILPGMASLFHEAETCERRAWQKWCQRKMKMEMSRLTGRCKTPLPWSF
jgi:hypothetical protein